MKNLKKEIEKILNIYRDECRSYGPEQAEANNPTPDEILISSLLRLFSEYKKEEPKSRRFKKAMDKIRNYSFTEIDKDGKMWRKIREQDWQVIENKTQIKE